MYTRENIICDMWNEASACMQCDMSNDKYGPQNLYVAQALKIEMIKVRINIIYYFYFMVCFLTAFDKRQNNTDTNKYS